jgi:peptidoglycan/xylan/chitin deacetylase (PgdA/CDA1 family)
MTAPARVRVEAGERTDGCVATLELEPPLCPPWLSVPRVRIWLARRLRPWSSGGAVLAHLDTGAERRPAIVKTDDGVWFRFDPDEVIAAHLTESWLTPRRPLHSRVSLPYHWVPGSIRLRLFEALVRPRAEVPPGFPEWPIDASVETLRFVARRLQGLDTRAADWPDGKQSAFVVSHDVDTPKGLALAEEVGRFEADLGLRATWFIVGDVHAGRPTVARALAEMGHEIGLHGDRHDNTLAYEPRHRMAARLERFRTTQAELGITGFRAPSLLETAALRQELRRSFAYASDIPDTEVDSLIAPRRGCGSCLPFERDGLLEIPITLPLEDKLIMRAMTGDEIFRFWREKAAWIQQAGGVVQLALHNEPHLLRRSRDAFERLAREKAADPTLWRPTLGELASWWKTNEAARA